ncbi:hypothetical protein PLICRDRAFT_628418 [Plicaturopsis crispa FD-325 SS-3]|nr:hypothetical protein PLICRDRAFT_628418 [Plicaturopsis crispa FD-325 SS-3]
MATSCDAYPPSHATPYFDIAGYLLSLAVFYVLRRVVRSLIYSLSDAPVQCVSAQSDEVDVAVAHRNCEPQTDAPPVKPQPTAGAGAVGAVVSDDVHKADDMKSLPQRAEDVASGSAHQPQPESQLHIPSTNNTEREIVPCALNTTSENDQPSEERKVIFGVPAQIKKETEIPVIDWLSDGKPKHTDRKLRPLPARRVQYLQPIKVDEPRTTYTPQSAVAHHSGHRDDRAKPIYIPRVEPAPIPRVDLFAQAAPGAHANPFSRDESVALFQPVAPAADAIPISCLKVEPRSSADPAYSPRVEPAPNPRVEPVPEHKPHFRFSDNQQSLTPESTATRPSFNFAQIKKETSPEPANRFFRPLPVRGPRSIEPAKLKAVKVEERVRVKVEEPEPVKIEEDVSVKVEEVEPAKFEEPVPVDVQESVPVKVEDPEPIKVEESRATYTPQSAVANHSFHRTAKVKPISIPRTEPVPVSSVETAPAPRVEPVLNPRIEPTGNTRVAHAPSPRAESFQGPRFEPNQYQQELPDEDTDEDVPLERLTGRQITKRPVWAMHFFSTGKGKLSKPTSCEGPLRSDIFIHRYRLSNGRFRIQLWLWDGKAWLAAVMGCKHLDLTEYHLKVVDDGTTPSWVKWPTYQAWQRGVRRNQY